MDYVLSKKRFYEALSEKGFNGVSDFRESAGLHRNTLSQYLRGEKGVLAEAFSRIASALDCDPLELIYARQQNYTEASNETLHSLLTDALNSYPNICAVLLGSRAQGKARRTSDWDIGLCEKSGILTSNDYLDIKEKILSLSDDLPVGIDVINLSQAPRWFLVEINYKPLFLFGNKLAYSYLLGILDGLKKN